MNKTQSRMAIAMKEWNNSLKSYSEPPKGMFGRAAIIKSGNVTINSNELDFEFTVNFDDDMEANEAEIIVYNLSKTTIQALNSKQAITITAGYGNDTGVIFTGDIVKVKTKHEETDKVTTITAFDFDSGTGEDITEKTYKKGTKASYILKDLLNYIKLPIAVFEPLRDHVYKDEQKIDGEIWEAIKTYAEVCGISVYINKGKVYARHLTIGDNINFTVEESTGLIGSPEEFEEQRTAEDYTDIIKGYNFSMLLQHRMTTAAIINLKSVNASGKFRVRSGKHIWNEDEAITELEVING